VPIEIVSWRLTAQGPEDSADSARTPPEAHAAPLREVVIPLWPDAGPAKVYARASLGRGQALSGPALIEERETTVVLSAGWDALVDDTGCIIARRRT
jgi:N-methylhydantoinase A